MSQKVSLTDLLKPPPPVRRTKAYAIENTGRVWSLASVGGPIRPTLDRRGTLVLPGTTQEVALLVAEAWVQKPEGATTVVHIDGDRTNVSATNLLWK